METHFSNIRLEQNLLEDVEDWQFESSLLSGKDDISQIGSLDRDATSSTLTASPRE